MAPETEPAPLAVTAHAVPLDPADPAHDRIGRLRYMGGLALGAPDRRFGGISGMRFLADGRLLTVTDGGDWIALTPREDQDRLIGIGPATIARMADLTGRPLRSRLQSDAEALEIAADGQRIVAFARVQRVWRFDPLERRPRARAFPDPSWLAGLPTAGGISAVARIGTLWLFLAEDAGSNAWNGILEGAAAHSPAYGRVAYTPPAGFAPTDAAALNTGEVLILNRSYSATQGIAAALTLARVDAAHLALGKPTVLARFASPLTIDNMEALDVRHVGERTFVYMASDDNYSPLQRTLLLKFELLPR